MAMSPGTYLRKRREAAGLDVDDVAAMLPTEPHVDALARAAWLRQIEADQAPIGSNVMAALRYAFSFDPLVLQQLDELRLDPTRRAPRVCRRCACSRWDACEPPCAWVAADLCSACPVEDPDADALPGPDDVAIPGEQPAAPANDAEQGIAA